MRRQVVQQRLRPWPVVGAMGEQVGHRVDQPGLDLVGRAVAAADLLHVCGDPGQRPPEHVALLLLGPVRVVEPLHHRDLGDTPGVLGVDKKPVHVEQNRGELWVSRLKVSRH